MNSSQSFRVFVRKLYWLTLGETKARYRGTFAGLLWVLVNPLVYFAVIWLAFHENLGRSHGSYPLFLVASLIPWTFVSSTLSSNVNVLCASRGLLLSLPVEPWLLVGAKVLDQFVNFAIVLTLMTMAFGRELEPGIWRYGALLLAVGNALVFAAVALRGLASLQVFFRDTQFILQFVNGVMVFLTPIFFPLTAMPVTLQRLQVLNPYFAIIHPFQVCLTGGSLSTFGEAFARALGCTLLTALVGRFAFRYRDHALYQAL